MNNEPTACLEPYYGPPACNTTLATHFGETYTIYCEVYATCFAFLLIFLIIQFVRIVKTRGLRPIVAQKIIHIGLFWPSLGWIVKSVDPNGWKGIISQPVIQFITDSSTAMLYSLITVIAFAWIKIVSRMSPTRTSEHQLFWMQVSFQAVIWVVCISTSLLLSLMDQRWVYRILQMVANAGILLCVFGMALHQGYAIYRSMHVQKSERLLRGSGVEKSSSMRSEQSSDSLPNEARREVAKRLLKVLVCGTAVIFPTIFFQVVEVAENLTKRYTNTLSNPRPPPSSVLSYSAFEAFQLVGCLVLLFIFYKVSPPQQQTNVPEQVPVGRRKFDNQRMTLGDTPPRTPNELDTPDGSRGWANTYSREEHDGRMR